MSVPMESPVVAEACKNHPDALRFLRDMAQVMHTWDDLYDRDQPVPDGALHQAFWLALVAIPGNPFYRENEETLRTIVVNSIINWRIANAYERRPVRDSEEMGIAFIIRSSYIDLATMCATLIGGVDWAVHHGIELRKWCHSEGFCAYLENLDEETTAREGVPHVLPG